VRKNVARGITEIESIKNGQMLKTERKQEYEELGEPTY